MNPLTQRRTMGTIAIGLLLTWLGGCAGMNDGSDGFAQGWRRAKVVELHAAAQALDRSHLECQAKAPTDAPTQAQLIASYSVAGNPNLRNLRVVTMPAGERLAVGDAVLINVRDCQVSLRRLVADPHA